MDRRPTTEALDDASGRPEVSPANGIVSQEFAHGAVVFLDLQGVLGS